MGTRSSCFIAISFHVRYKLASASLYVMLVLLEEGFHGPQFLMPQNSVANFKSIFITTNLPITKTLCLTPITPMPTHSYVIIPTKKNSYSTNIKDYHWIYYLKISCSLDIISNKIISRNHIIWYIFHIQLNIKS